MTYALLDAIFSVIVLVLWRFGIIDAECYLPTIPNWLAESTENL
jgi:hypothetical protein